jgi:hypothetical protein
MGKRRGSGIEDLPPHSAFPNRLLKNRCDLPRNHVIFQWVPPLDFISRMT